MNDQRSGISWNELPKFSTWPERLLDPALESRQKNAAELSREYEQEKWGPLLEALRGEDSGGLHLADDLTFRDCPPQPCWDHGVLRILPALEAFDVYRTLVMGKLSAPRPGQALVELGAGYGAILLWLKQQQDWRETPIFAGEFTASGQELAGLIAEREGLAVTTGWCDFFDPRLTDLPVPESSLIFTSFAMACVPELSDRFVDGMLEFRPSRVWHFEPIREHFDRGTLTGLMQERYLAANDYNRNLLAVLKRREAEGCIRIVSEEKCFFGLNPLIPLSSVAWEPV